MAQVAKVEWRSLYTWILVIPPVVLLAYAGLILCKTWPIQEFSVEKAGVFGDSFGLVNALFSGFAFAGVIITMLLQKEQLGLQLNELSESSKQFERTADAQERTAFLTAQSELLREYNENMNVVREKILEERAKVSNSLSSYDLSGVSQQQNTDISKLNFELIELQNKKNIIITELEKSLSNKQT